MTTKYYITKGHSGGLVVSNQPPTMDDYVEGPWIDHNDAFDRMQELERSHEHRRAAFEFFLIMGAMSVVVLAGNLLL